MKQHTRPLDGKLDPFFDLSLDALCVAGFDGDVKRVNAAFAHTLGYPGAEVVARPFTDTVHPEDVESVRATFLELASSNDLGSFECRHLCAGGTVLSLEWKSKARPDDELIYCVGRDVTEGRRDDDQLTALRRVATLVAEGVPPGDLFAVAAAEVARVVEAPVVGIMGYRSEGTAVHLVASFANEGEVEVGAYLPLDGTSVVSEIRASGSAARIDDYTGLTGTIAERMRSDGLRSTVGSPIVVAGRLWGAMVVSTRDPEPLPPGTETRLADFTELLASAIANAESFETLQLLAEDQAALRKAATMVAEGLSASEIFSAICEDVGRLFDSEAAAIVRFETEPPPIIVVGITGIPGLAVGTRSELRDEFASTQVYRTGRSGRVDARDLESGSGPLLEPARQQGLSSTVASPIVVEGRLWGSIGVSAKTPFPRGTEARLERFGELVATAIASANEREALERLAGEQAALRRVATLVVQGAPSIEIFSAVSAEIAQLVGADNAHVSRFDEDRAFIVMGLTWGLDGVTVGSRFEFDDWMTTSQVYRTGRAARIDGVDWSNVDGAFGDAGRRHRVVSSVSGPIVVNGHLWGVITVTSSQPLPPDTEVRLGNFTELVATAIANAESREALERLVDEQASLRRVATLVAQGVPPVQIFSAVSTELDRLFGLDQAFVGRFDPSGPEVVAVGVAKPDDRVRLGSRWEHNELYAPSRVFRTGRSARVDEHELGAGGPVAEWLRSHGFLVQLASPITVEGHLWGALTITAQQPFPGDAADRLEKFSELVATAIANAESKSELAASRRRIVAASDEARRRIERDLHDGTQQRLIALRLEVRTAEADVPPDHLELRSALSHIGAGLTEVVTELQEISRGIHPAILSQGGLGPALRALARRSPIAVNLNITTTSARLPAPVEVATYYAVSEALANAAKHSGASSIEVALEPRNDGVVLSIRDDGVGGADPARGSGLVGLTDRLEALGGSIQVNSPPGGGTHLVAVLPRELDQPTDAN